MRPVDIARILCATVIAWGCLTGALHAADVTVTPGISVRETYDDNVFLRDESDFETQLSPKVSVSSVTPSTTLTLDAQADVFRYVSLKEYDRIEYNADMGLSYAISPLATIAVSVGGTKDDTFADELETTGRIINAVTRWKLSGNTTLTLFPSQRNQFSLSAGGSVTRYEDDQQLRSDVVNAALQWTHVLSQRTSLLSSLGFSLDHSYDSSTDIWRSYGSLSTGFQHALLPTLSISMQGGVTVVDTRSAQSQRRTVTTVTGDSLVIDLGSQEDNSRNVNFNANASVDWNPTERTSLSVSYLHSIGQDIQANQYTQNRLNARFSQAITERLDFLFDATGFLTTYDSSDRSGNLNIFLTPSISYAIGEYTSISLNYSHYRKWDTLQWEQVWRNRVFLEFSSDWPFKP